MTKFKLTKDQYDEIIDMAGFGVGYWASAMRSTKKGCYFTEDETGSKYFVTRKRMEKAILEIFMSRGVYEWGNLGAYYLSAIDLLVTQGCTGDCGSDISEVIIQQACFRSVLYG